MTFTEQDFEKDILPDLDDSHDDSEKELAVFGEQLHTLKGTILENVNKQQDRKDRKEAESLLNTLQDDISKTDDKNNIISSSNNTPLNIQKIIEEKIGDENLLANQGRVQAYTNVSDFATHVSNQGGIFGKLVSWLS